MNGKAVNGLIILVSISLVCPLQSSAVRSPLSRHKSQVSSASHKAGEKEHHHQSTADSAAALEHDDARGQHQQLSSAGKEPPLVRLKRIKRQIASLKTIQQPSSSNSNSKYADALVRNSDKLNLMDGRTPATPLGSFHEFGGGRVHTEMLQRLEDANRKLFQHGGGGNGRGSGLRGGMSSKTNEIAELRKGHHIKDGGRYRLTGTGNYAHHKHEQDNLDNTAAVVAAVRQRNRKNKLHQKNRSDFSAKGSKARNFGLAPRLRPGDRIQDGEMAKMPGRGRGRGHAEDKGHPMDEAKHRTRRGQRYGMASSSYKAGGHSEGVKTELERIRRMQRDLMKEISHLEHMKKKKKQRRNVTERTSQGQRKVSAPKRK